MRLLLIGPEARELQAVRNFSGVWSHYLTQEFERAGIEVGFEPSLSRTPLRPGEVVNHYRHLPLDGYDHIIALGTRYFEKVPAECASVLRSRFRGAVTQLHDGKSRAGVDCTFTVKRVALPRHHCVGWAADPELCRPKQDRRELRILVDHPNYVTLRGDKTKDILRDIKRFVRSGAWRSKFSSVRVRRIADGAVVDGSEPVTRYSRQSIPLPAICEEYSKAHLFMVTHRESIGLSVLETAMAGALPVAPHGFIPADRLATVRHVKYERAVPWSQVLQAIDIEASREMAKAHTWTKVAARIIGWLEKFQK